MAISFRVPFRIDCLIWGVVVVTTVRISCQVDSTEFTPPVRISRIQESKRRRVSDLRADGYGGETPHCVECSGTGLPTSNGRVGPTPLCQMFVHERAIDTVQTPHCVECSITGLPPQWSCWIYTPHCVECFPALSAPLMLIQPQFWLILISPDCARRSEHRLIISRSPDYPIHTTHLTRWFYDC